MSNKVNLRQLQAYKGSLTHYLPEVLVLYLITFRFTVILELIFAYGVRNGPSLNLFRYEYLLDSASVTKGLFFPCCVIVIFEINQVTFYE